MALESETWTCSRCVPAELPGPADGLGRGAGNEEREMRTARRLLTRALGCWCCQVLVWEHLGAELVCGRVGVVAVNPVWHCGPGEVWDVYYTDGGRSSTQQDPQAWSSEESRAERWHIHSIVEPDILNKSGKLRQLERGFHHSPQSCTFPLLWGRPPPPICHSPQRGDGTW